MTTNLSTEQLTSALEKAGLKATKKRVTVFHSLMVANRALSAYELAKFCKQELDFVIPVVSIYRILDLLVNKQLAHKLELVNKYIVCAHLECPTSHPHPQFLICNLCHKVTELHIPQQLTDQLTTHVKRSGFELQSPQLEFRGVCSTCLN